MNRTAKRVPFKDRSRILDAIGILLLLLGLSCAALGPAELYCFYFFTEGGRFHYQGFGFGSFMFAFIAVQIIGYYVIAFLCIPLGYGHLRLRRWARTLSLAGLGFWFIMGVPLVITFLAILVLAKDMSMVTVLAMLPLMALLYPVLPAVLTRFYRSRDVKLTFEARDPKSYWTEQLPSAIWVLCFLLTFWIIALHLAILLRGAFPLFGMLVTELPGILLLDASILVVAALTWGTFRLQVWAWWGAVAYFCVLTLSTISTFLRLGWSDILDALKFAPLEANALAGVPIRGIHLAAFFGVPLAATLGCIIYSKRFFAPIPDTQDARLRHPQP